MGKTQNEIDKNEILHEKDPGALSVKLYNFAYKYKFDKDVFDLCQNIITKDPHPEVSAACLKISLRMWVIINKDIVSSFNFYLKKENFWEYFDECLIIFNFLKSSDGAKFRNNFSDLTVSFARKAKAEGLLHDADLMGRN